jgi:hypothetical protein
MSPERCCHYYGPDHKGWDVANTKVHAGWSARVTQLSLDTMRAGFISVDDHVAILAAAAAAAAAEVLLDK